MSAPTYAELLEFWQASQDVLRCEAMPIPEWIKINERFNNADNALSKYNNVHSVPQRAGIGQAS